MRIGHGIPRSPRGGSKPNGETTSMSMAARGFRLLALNVLLIVLYAGLGRLTFAASVEYGNVSTVVFAPEGVALALAILFGPRIAPGIVLGQVLLSYWCGPSLLGGIAIGGFNAAEAVLGAWLFRRWRLSSGFGRPRDVALFIFMILFILQPISATGGVLTLYANSMVPAGTMDWLLSPLGNPLEPLSSPDLLPSAWLHWWLGNALGQMLVTPLLLSWLTPANHKSSPRLRLELTVMVAGTAGVLLLAHGFPTLRPALLLLCYALMIWIGLRRGIRAVTLFNLVITAGIVAAAVQGGNILANLPDANRLFYIGFFISIGIFASLILYAMFQERRDLIQQLTELASKDPLTHASNRRHFLEQAERELALARRHRHPVSLVLVDLDNFKDVNDRFGHTTGDDVLKAFVRCCDATLRTGDLVGRIGGEEFALMLPRANLRDACDATERLRRIFAGLPMTATACDAPPVHVTFSAGVVEQDGQATLAELYRAADQALYQAKHAGRNRVAVSPAAAPDGNALAVA